MIRRFVFNTGKMLNNLVPINEVLFVDGNFYCGDALSTYYGENGYNSVIYMCKGEII